MVETVSPLPFNCKNLYSGVLRCFHHAREVVGTFIGRVRLLATAYVIFRWLEVIESVFLVFERVVFLNNEKKKSVWLVLVTKI